MKKTKKKKMKIKIFPVQCPVNPIFLAKDLDPNQKKIHTMMTKIKILKAKIKKKIIKILEINLKIINLPEDKEIPIIIKIIIILHL